MQKISSEEIKNRFLKFFQENKHMQISDSSIIPKNDPTLLFINSGMAPLKNYFTGVQKPPCPRLCNVQPCIRTIDIDSIGDKHHLTSFQMLGSWSINDYFKEKAIYFAYTLLTQAIGIEKEKLYVTVFSGDKEMNLPFDQESYDCWRKVGVSEDHIIACGKEDNFWGPTSETGPCGPCTEIFFDTGDGEKYIPGGNFDTKKRYIEIWNAGVFMQFNKNSDGTFSKLAFSSVDTGAGLERLAMVLGGYSSVYDTDLLYPIREKIEENLENKSDLTETEKFILTDHLRTTCLILSEKVTPSNEGRGYTPRKLIRRCMMIVFKNKIKKFDFLAVIRFIVERYKGMFPKFEENKNFVLEEFAKEYAQFEKVLKNGLEKLEILKGESGEISGDIAFELVTTYGLPFDIIKEYAKEHNLKLDELGYQSKIKIHREKSKNLNSSKEVTELKKWLEMLGGVSPTVFTGYDELKSNCKILKIIKDNEFVSEASQGELVGVVVDKTSLYAESGGQCSDIGYIVGENFKIKIKDVKKNKQGTFLHLGTVEVGTAKVKDEAITECDELVRKQTSCNHTSVHLLHSALRKLFGNELHQAGSRVESKRLRFDFNYDSSIKEDDINQIESIVNGSIRANIVRNLEIKDVAQAISDGAMALFESKYGDKVRVVSYGDVSSELCGGTHVERTGDIGLFIIVSAESIGKGIRRITAITGDEALRYVQNKIKDINLISSMYKVKPDGLVQKLQNQLSKAPNEKSSSVNIDNVKKVDLNSEFKLGYCSIDQFGKKTNNEVIKIADTIGGIMVCACVGEKKQLIVAVSDKLQPKVQANVLIKELSEVFGGKGGGNKKIATLGIEVSEDKLINELKRISDL